MVDFDLFDIISANARANVDDHISTVESFDANRVSVSLYDFSTPGTPALQTSAKACQTRVVGNSPMAFLPVVFGKLADDKSWFDSRDYGDMKLYATQAAAGACKIITQQHII